MTEPLQTYRDLTVWQKAMDLVTEIYSLTKTFPDDERFGLTSQLRRSVVSIPSNIAEGYVRDHRGDYLRFLSIANGSLKEAETQVILANRLEYITREQSRQVWELMQVVGKLLNGLIRSLKSEP